MWNLKYDTNDISMKQKQTYRHREQTCGCWKGVWVRDGLGIWGQQIQTIYIGWVNNKVQPYSTGNYVRYAVINHNGKEYEWKRI